MIIGPRIVGTSDRHIAMVTVTGKRVPNTRNHMRHPRADGRVLEATKKYGVTAQLRLPVPYSENLFAISIFGHPMVNISFCYD